MLIREATADDLCLCLNCTLNCTITTAIGDALENLWHDILADKNHHIIIGIHKATSKNSCFALQIDKNKTNIAVATYNFLA